MGGGKKQKKKHTINERLLKKIKLYLKKYLLSEYMLCGINFGNKQLRWGSLFLKLVEKYVQDGLYRAS